MKCTCEAWEIGIRQIDGALTLSFLHSGKYTAGVFKFCPWCGKELQSEGEQIAVKISPDQDLTT